ncbi:hypothetical protein BDF19DRAFT_446098 [Syncephalis fuscata]|nr:hypothetical protein BDF19DRAFT_446098 [Syncephalis fuscata]
MMLPNSKSFVALIATLALVSVSQDVAAISSPVTQASMPFDGRQFFGYKLNVPGAFGIEGLKIVRASGDEGESPSAWAELNEQVFKFSCGKEGMIDEEFMFYKGTKYASVPIKRIVPNGVYKSYECFMATFAVSITNLIDFSATDGALTPELAKNYIKQISEGLSYILEVGWLPAKIGKSFYITKEKTLFYRNHSNNVKPTLIKDVANKAKAINEYNIQLLSTLGVLYKQAGQADNINAGIEMAKKKHPNLVLKV